MRIEAAIGVSWVLRADGRRSSRGIRHSSATLPLRGMPANRVVAAGVRAAISTVHDPYDCVVFESAPAGTANTDGCGRSRTVDDVVSTRAAMGGSISPAGGGAVAI